MRSIDSGSKFWAYIIQCCTGAYYTGYTNNLEKRIKEHNSSKRGAKCLRGKGPVEVVWIKNYKRRYYAMKAEYKIKQLNRRQKELLVGGMRLDKVLGERRKNKLSDNSSRQNSGVNAGKEKSGPPCA